MPPLGTINNPKGRGKGTQNKVTAELRERIKTFLDGSFDSVQEDFKLLDPVQRLNFYEKMIRYVVPQMTANDLKIDFDQMSDSQLDEIVNRLISKQ